MFPGWPVHQMLSESLQAFQRKSTCMTMFSSVKRLLLITVFHLFLEAFRILQCGKRRTLIRQSTQTLNSSATRTSSSLGLWATWMITLWNAAIIIIQSHTVVSKSSWKYVRLCHTSKHTFTFDFSAGRFIHFLLCFSFSKLFIPSGGMQPVCLCPHAGQRPPDSSHPQKSNVLFLTPDDEHHS